MNTRFQRLQKVAGLLADRALAPVAEATAAVRAIEDRISELAFHREKLMQAAQDPTMAGPMLSQAERLRLLHAAALRDLATARVRLETVRKMAAKAVGRDRALQELAQREAQLAIKKKRRASL